jgi:hypothetical protein
MVRKAALCAAFARQRQARRHGRPGLADGNKEMIMMKTPLQNEFQTSTERGRPLCV